MFCKLLKLRLQISVRQLADAKCAGLHALKICLQKEVLRFAERSIIVCRIEILVCRVLQSGARTVRCRPANSSLSLLNVVGQCAHVLTHAPNTHHSACRAQGTGARGNAAASGQDAADGSES